MNTWKVIAVDNYDREYRSDWLIKDGLTKLEAIDLAEIENRKTGMYSDWFYRAVPSDHKLFTFVP